MTRTANTTYPIHELLQKRWSPYSFEPRTVPADVLRSLFEAASWAASSFNEQPWRFLLATRDNSAAFEKALNCLVDMNQAWAKNASAIALTCTRDTFTYNDKANGVAQHDLGAAAASLTFEATARGLYVHQMGGIKADVIREQYEVPEGYTVQTAIAIGYIGDLENNSLPDDLSKRDQGERERKPLSEFVFEGTFGIPATITK